jgi:hypothetical protein
LESGNSSLLSYYNKNGHQIGDGIAVQLKPKLFFQAAKRIDANHPLIHSLLSSKPFGNSNELLNTFDTGTNTGIQFEMLFLFDRATRSVLIPCWKKGRYWQCQQ